MNFPVEWIDRIGGLWATFALHATLLLAAAWLLERLRVLREPGWREWAWRVALFGAFASLALRLAPWPLPEATLSNPSAQDGIASVLAQQRQSAALPASSAAAAADPRAAEKVDTTAPRHTGATATPGAASAHASAAASAGSAEPERSTAEVWPRAALWLSPPWQLITAVLALWLCGTLIALAQTLRQAIGLLLLRRRLLSAGHRASSTLYAEAAALAAGLGLRVPRLRIVDALPSPLALPGAVVLPQWALALDASRQRAMLAHELAHLSRRDPLWRALQRIALAPLWWHPLAWHALRRLEALAETRCDATAVSLAGACVNARAGRARALAECLAECLSHHLAGRTAGAHPTLARRSGWALAMAEHGDGILGRVRDLLETSAMQTSPPKRRWRWIAAAAALLMLAALPAVHLIVRNDHALSVVIDEGDERRAIYSDMRGDERFRVRMDGDVRFTADERDVATLGADARLRIERREDGTTRQIEILREGERIVRRYRVDGVERAYDADARAWLARQIPDIYRISGYQAETRARRMLAAGGADALIAEIEAIGNPYVRATYLEQLLALSDVDAAQAERVFALIDGNTSDFERRRMLIAALARFAATPERHPRMLQTAQRMGSDFERTEWLIEAADALPVTGAALGAWARALDAAGSDFERRRALEALARDGRPRLQAAAVALVAADGLGSDFERRSALQTLAEQRVPLDVARYLATTERIGSDFERREALLALLARGPLDADTSRALLRSVRGMQSDFERTQVLAALAARMPRDLALIDDYRAVTRGMSDHERGEAEKALDRFYPEG